MRTLRPQRAQFAEDCQLAEAPGSGWGRKAIENEKRKNTKAEEVHFNHFNHQFLVYKIKKANRLSYHLYYHQFTDAGVKQYP